MQRTPPFPFLPDLVKPLRDAMRGVANFAEATEDALEPAAQLLPEPLRDGFQKAIRSIETTGKHLMVRRLEHAQIRAAGDFAKGEAQDADAAQDFATVLCFAWEHLQDNAQAPRLMISETILTSKVSLPSGHETGADCAADLIGSIRRSSAIGRMPGISEGITAEDREQIDLALVAILTWLLAARADTLAEDVALLDLAMALVTAFKTDVVSAMDARDKLSHLLHTSSVHL